MFFRPQRVHFTGIGGIGMSGIAEVLLNLGYEISGSDLRLSATTARLAQLGRPFLKGTPQPTSPALRPWWSVRPSTSRPRGARGAAAANSRHPRGEMLAELMRLKYGIAVAGSHGKTSTTSIIATVLNGAGLDPTVVVGGRVGAMGGANAAWAE